MPNALRHPRRGQADSLPARLPAVLVPLASPARRPRQRPRGVRTRHARLQPLLPPGGRRGLPDAPPARRRPRADRAARHRPADPRRPRLGRHRLLGLRPQVPRDARASRDHRRGPALHLEPRPAREPQAAAGRQLHARVLEALAGARGHAVGQRLLADGRPAASDRRARSSALGRGARRLPRGLVAARRAARRAQLLPGGPHGRAGRGRRSARGVRQQDHLADRATSRRW